LSTLPYDKSGCYGVPFEAAALSVLWVLTGLVIIGFRLSVLVLIKNTNTCAGCLEMWRKSRNFADSYCLCGASGWHLQAI